MSIVENRKAFHDYFIEERFEAGIALEGWEVKAIRAGRANLKEALASPNVDLIDLEIDYSDNDRVLNREIRELSAKL